MISAFGVDHGEISKASILGAGHALNRGAGAGGMAARKLYPAGSARHGPTKLGYGQARQSAKKSGQNAARHYARNGDVKGFGAEYHANTGWQDKARAVTNLPANRPAPAGMRGPIKSRVKTKKMAEFERGFM